ncbi:MAG: hypothetical protein GX379_07870 [Clostridiales bacterium]|jgi:hypothetical protein|nr:hypothetical protein [Clostridiales bacterium]
MKLYNKKLALTIAFFCLLVLTGCSKVKLTTYKDNDEANKIEKNNDSKEIDDSNTDSIDNPSDDEDLLDSNDKTPSIIQPSKNIELLIYVVNSSSDLDPITALVPADSEITPELIVDTVVDSMADRSIVIGIESVTTQDDAVIVSFYADQPPISNVGSSLEESILNAIAQSLTDNLDDYSKVIYRVEGGPYASGHIELGLDEVYHED